MAPRPIASWTGPTPAEGYAEFISCNRDATGVVAVHARQADGTQVTVKIPADAWSTLKGQLFREPRPKV